MAATIIDGKAVAQAVKAEVAQRVSVCVAAGVRPTLAVVLVGDNPASVSYVTAKERDCEEVGIDSRDIRHPAEISETHLLGLIAELNADDAVHGILVQLPLPAHIDADRVLTAIAPHKDVDGFHPVSLGRLMMGLPTYVPCTPAGVVELLMRGGYAPAGKHVVIVGRSNIVGRPLANLLSRKAADADATVTLCHSRSGDLSRFTLQADILVAAIGSPRLISGAMIKPGAVVIDVGVNRVEDATKKSGFRLVGDVDYDAALERAAAVTPVPGGVGPMTRAMLLVNTVAAAERGAQPW